MEVSRFYIASTLRMRCLHAIFSTVFLNFLLIGSVWGQASDATQVNDYKGAFVGHVTSVTETPPSGVSVNDVLTGSFDFFAGGNSQYYGAALPGNFSIRLDGYTWSTAYIDGDVDANGINLVGDADIDNATGPGFLGLDGDFDVNIGDPGGTSLFLPYSAADPYDPSEFNYAGITEESGYMSLARFGNTLPYDISYQVDSFAFVPEPSSTALILIFAAALASRKVDLAHRRG